MPQGESISPEDVQSEGVPDGSQIRWGGVSLEFLEGKELPGVACLRDK